MRWPIALAFGLAACSPPRHSATGATPTPPAPPGPPLIAAPQPERAFALVETSVDLNGRLVGAAPVNATMLVVFASWCGHCHDELDVIEQVLVEHRSTRVLGVNYRGHEEYDGRGGSEAVRRYVQDHAPWLRVVPADDALFRALGRPPKIPTIYVYDRAGALVTRFDRRERPMPDADELDTLLTRLGG